MRWEENRLVTIVQNSTSQSEVLQQLGLANVGGNGTTLKRYCRLWNIDVSHFVPCTGKSFIAIPLEKILVEHSSLSVECGS